MLRNKIRRIWMQLGDSRSRLPGGIPVLYVLIIGLHLPLYMMVMGTCFLPLLLIGEAIGCFFVGGYILLQKKKQPKS